MDSWSKGLVRRILPGKIKKHRILAGPLRGKHIVTSWHDYPAAILGRTEKALLEWFEKNVRAGETWLDVGAHYGYTAIALSELVGGEGRVFAFEPVLETAGHLAETRALNRLFQLRVLPMGLANPEELRSLQMNLERGMAEAFNRDGHSETIMVARLDWLWPRICGANERIDGVKIDVQGMEIETLYGMAHLCWTFRPKLVVEIHRGVDHNHLLNVIGELGYRRSGFAIEGGGKEIVADYLCDQSYAFRPA
ncbi:MAG: FkbM family methyltransferase [Acidobacteria bacterium]|nr:FkbM family methyltransferase [Acidobacteriota bacterium]